MFLEGHLQDRGGLRSSLDTDDLTVLPIDKQTHHYGKLENFAFTERMQLNHFMDILPHQLLHKSEIERDVFPANDEDIALAFFSVLLVLLWLVAALFSFLLRGTWLAASLLLCSLIFLLRLISLKRLIFGVVFHSRRILLFLEGSPSLPPLLTRLLAVDSNDGLVTCLSVNLGCASLACFDSDCLTGSPRDLGSSCDLNNVSLAH